METETSTYNKPTLIINYLCDNTKIGLKNATARFELPYSSVTLRNVAKDPEYFFNRVKGIALRRCPFNQIQRVKCDIYAYITVIGKKVTEGELIKLYENVELVNKI